MGVRTAELFLTGRLPAILTPVLTAPFTDDPVVPIAVVMGISGTLMLVLGILRLVEWIRRKREEKRK
ncbi:MAG: hypothetical protein IJX14_10715 [Clostridia bacterium]|nr:hypothetical protein [Clostridia bacterium]